MAPLLGYWKIRGLAHCIRFMLSYKGVEFEEKMYEMGDAPDYSKEDWFKEKFNLGLELPNLPYYMDDEVKITETSAIINHIVRKYGLGASTEAAQAKADMIYSWHSGQRMQVVQTIYDPEFENKREGLVKTFPEKLDTISKLLGDQKFLTGDEVTYVDFVVYELVHICRLLSEGCITQDNVKAFMQRIDSMPELKSMFEKYKDLPFNNKVAKWGAGPMQ